MSKLGLGMIAGRPVVRILELHEANTLTSEHWRTVGVKWPRKSKPAPPPRSGLPATGLEYTPGWYTGDDLLPGSFDDDNLAHLRSKVAWQQPPEVRPMIWEWFRLEELEACREYVARIRSGRYMLKREGGWADRTR